MKQYRSIVLFGVFLVGLFCFAANPTQAQVTNTDLVKDWHGSVALGLSLAKGNTDTLLMNANVLAEKDWKWDEWTFGADGTYGLNNWGRSNETETANNLHGFVDYKRLFSDRFYASLHLEGLHDDLAGVRYRIIVGPSAGYYFIKAPDTRLNLSIGPSYIKERLDGEDKSYMTLRIAERGEHNLSKGAKVWEQAEYLPQVDDFSNYLLNSEVGAEAALNAHLSLRITAQDKYNNKPALGRKSNDILLVASVVWKFGS